MMDIHPRINYNGMKRHDNLICYCGRYNVSHAFLRLESRYICIVSDACIQRIYYKLSATFSDKNRRPNFTYSPCWRNPVDDKAGLALYSTHAVFHAATNPMFRSCMVWRCRVCLLWLKIVDVKVDSQSQTSNSTIEAASILMWLRLCRTILMTFYDMNHYVSHWACDQVLHFITYLNISVV